MKPIVAQTPTTGNRGAAATADTAAAAPVNTAPVPATIAPPTAVLPTLY